MSVHLCPSPECAASHHTAVTSYVSSTGPAVFVDMPDRPEPAEVRPLADAFEAAARRVARQTTRALRDRAVTVAAAANPDPRPAGFHVDPDQLLHPEWWADAVDVFIADLLTVEIMDAGAATAADLGVAFDVVNPALERVATAHIDAITSWGQDMRTWVAGKVRQGMLEGLSVPNMAKALVDPGDSPLNPVRARATAQTELIAGQNGASYATYTASGLTGVKRWMCVLPDTPVAGLNVSHVARRWHEGWVVDLHTASMQRGLAVSPNHLVLTQRGWVPAGEVHKGDYLVRCAAADERLVDGADPEIGGEPPEACEVFAAAAVVGSVERVVGGVVDLDGDGGYRKVDVVAVDGKLRDRLQAAVPEHLRQAFLAETDESLVRLVADGAPAHRAVGDRPSCVGRGHPGDPGGLVGGVQGDAHQAGLALVADADAPLFQASPEPGGAALVSDREGFQRCPGLVGGHDVVTVLQKPSSELPALRLGADRLGGPGLRQSRIAGEVATRPLGGGCPEPHVCEAAADEVVVEAEVVADLAGGLAGLVALDQVVHVDRYPYAGHLYDLETEGHWFMAGPVIVHNSSHDGRVRPSHVAADGQERALGDDFEVGGYAGAYPGASSLPGRERLNCRCRITFEPADEQPSDQAAALTASVAAFQTTNPDGSVTYGGAMVAARVPAQFAVDQPGALAPGELHVTLQYLGNADIYDPAARALVAAKVADLVDDMGPFEVSISGWGVLGPEKAVVVYVEADELADIHDQLTEATPAPVSGREHPHFTPHFTLGYLGAESTRTDLAGWGLEDLTGSTFTVDEILVAFGCTVDPAGRVVYGPGSETTRLAGDDTEGMVHVELAHWDYQPRVGGRFGPDYVRPSVKIAQGQHPPGLLEHENPVTVADAHRAGVEHAAHPDNEPDQPDEPDGDEAGGDEVRVRAVDPPGRSAAGVVVVFFNEVQHPRGKGGRWTSKDFGSGGDFGPPPWGNDTGAATKASKQGKAMAEHLAKTGQAFGPSSVMLWATKNGLGGDTPEGNNFSHYVNVNQQRLKDVHYATGVLDKLPDKGEGQREVMNQVLDRLVKNGHGLTGENLDKAAKDIGLDDAGLERVRSWSVTHATFVAKMHSAAKKQTPGGDKPESPDPAGAPKKSKTGDVIDETPGAAQKSAHDAAEKAAGAPVAAPPKPVGQVGGEDVYNPIDLLKPGSVGGSNPELKDAVALSTATKQWSALNPGQKQFAAQFADAAVQKIKDAGGEVTIAGMQAEFAKTGYDQSAVSKGAYALVSMQPSKYGVATKTGDVDLPNPAAAGLATGSKKTKTPAKPKAAADDYDSAGSAAKADKAVKGHNAHGLPILKGTSDPKSVQFPQVNAKSSAESGALHAYHDNAYGSMNSNLRAGGKPSGKDAHLTELINRHQVPDDITVYRGTSSKVALKEGMVFADHGFISTDVSGSTAKGFESGTFMVIHVPAGTKGVHKLNQHHEDELVLQRGTVFQVVGKIKDQGKEAWHVEVVSQPLFKASTFDAKTPRYGEIEYKDAFRVRYVTV